LPLPRDVSSVVTDAEAMKLEKKISEKFAFEKDQYERIRSFFYLAEGKEKSINSDCPSLIFNIENVDNVSRKRFINICREQLKKIEDFRKQQYKLDRFKLLSVHRFNYWIGDIADDRELKSSLGERLSDIMREIWIRDINCQLLTRDRDLNCPGVQVSELGMRGFLVLNKAEEPTEVNVPAVFEEVEDPFKDAESRLITEIAKEAEGAPHLFTIESIEHTAVNQGSKKGISINAKVKIHIIDSKDTVAKLNEDANLLSLINVGNSKMLIEGSFDFGY